MLTIHVFPFISKMLISSEEQVQIEGVEALLKISKEYISMEEAQFLVFNIVDIIMATADLHESSKIAVLIIVERFADSKIFVA